MTKPKRWPKNAEAARMDSIGSAMAIENVGQEAKAAARSGKSELAMLLISEMQLAAKEIRLQLTTCK